MKKIKRMNKKEKNTNEKLKKTQILKHENTTIRKLKDKK